MNSIISTAHNKHELVINTVVSVLGTHLELPHLRKRKNDVNILYNDLATVGMC